MRVLTKKGKYLVIMCKVFMKSTEKVNNIKFFNTLFAIICLKSS